jgi:hypothetical protein
MTKTKAVDDYFKNYENPLKAEMMRVRDIILSTSDKITESIKWSAPSFAYKDNMATFNPRAKKFVNLTFHKGALINDESGLLIGDKPEARVARFNDMAEVESRKDDLQKVVLKWIATMDAGS